jgi:DNA-binding transcriptional LysR family regulator
MSLSRLRTFIEVYRQRSITGAARRLNLTQPAVSQHIAGLEASIGRPLFHRLPSGVEPTSAADELAADVGDRLDQAEAALAAARTRSVEVAGALHIVGHADFLAEVVAAELVPLVKMGIRVRLQTGSTAVVTQMLIEGLCDLGITVYPPEDDRLRCEVVREETLIAVAAPEVVKRIHERANLADALSDEPLLAYSLDRPLVDAWLQLNGLDIKLPLPALIGQDLRALQRPLKLGVGWTVLPQYLCSSALADGSLEEVVGQVGRAPLAYYLAWTASGLRQPRVAHARQALLWRLKRAD